MIVIDEEEVEELSIPTGWSIRELRELAEPERGITYGIVQPGHHVADGVPIIRVQNIGNGTVDTHDLMRVSPKIAASYSRTRLRGGELLLSLVGSVGSAAIAPPEVVGWNTARAVAVVPLLPEYDARWVRFCLRSKPLQHLMEVWCNTTVQATLNLKDVHRLPIPLPPKPERDAMVETLSAIDDKIELNRQMNRTMEEAASALFRSWFADFDPVVAKIAGRQPAHLSSALASLFPDSFRDSELGPIPKGWRVGRLDEVLVLQRGFDLPAGARTAGPYPIIAASGLNGTHHQFKVKGPGVTTGRSGVLGKVYYVEEDFWPLNTSLWIKEYPLGSPLHAYHLLQGMDIETYNAGSAVPTLNRNHVHNLPVVIPPPALVQAFETQARPFFQMRHHNQAESQTLAALRDTLLPKLLSGEVRVKDAAKLWEGQA